MKRITILLLTAMLFAGCKKEPIKESGPTYELKIEPDGYFYAIKVETTRGKGLVYMHDTDLTGAHTFTVNPVNAEDVSVYYVSSNGVWLKIYVNGQLRINQGQPAGSSFFYITKP